MTPRQPQVNLETAWAPWPWAENQPVRTMCVRDEAVVILAPGGQIPHAQTARGLHADCTRYLIISHTFSISQVRAIRVL